MTKTKTQNANEEILSAEELMKKFDKDSKSLCGYFIFQ